MIKVILIIFGILLLLGFILIVYAVGLRNGMLNLLENNREWGKLDHAIFNELKEKHPLDIASEFKKVVALSIGETKSQKIDEIKKKAKRKKLTKKSSKSKKK
jgi:hypothetical protein